MHVVLRQVKGQRSAAQAAAADVDSTPVERAHGHLEAVALLAEQVPLGHAAVLEHHHRGGRGAPPHFLLQLPERESRRALLDEDAGDLVLGGFAHDQVEIADRPSADETLGTVEHVVVAVLAGRMWLPFWRWSAWRDYRCRNWAL